MYFMYFIFLFNLKNKDEQRKTKCLKYLKSNIENEKGENLLQS